jgi:phosphatidylglycerophosphate synthase
VYFFRPAGMLVARAARHLGLTPTAVTLAGAAVGVAGGALLALEQLALGGFALIVLHSILDSADGQLARMTGQVSERGRVLDGVSGYVTHTAIYAAILAGRAATAGGSLLIPWAALAGVVNIVHAQMYDYHRGEYMRFAIAGVARPASSSRPRAGLLMRVVSVYEAAQRRLAGRHPEVARAIEARSVSGIVRPEDRVRYRACFYRPVRGWNLLGDNTRFYAIGVLAWLHHLEWFITFMLVPMNAALVALWLWQARADRRFLAGL